MICNLCKGREFLSMWELPSPINDVNQRIPRRHDSYHIDKCVTCGLMQVRERMVLSEKFLTTLYDADYFTAYGRGNSDGEDTYQRYLDKYRPFRHISRILNRAVVFETKKMLEIGCAYGGFLEEAAKLGWHVEGVELSSHAAQEAQKKGLTVHEGDLASVGLIPDSFDAVVSLATIEHLLDPKTFICHAAKLVRPGGIFMFTTIDMDGIIPKLLGQRWRQVRPPLHLYYFKQEQLVKYLTIAGLEPFRVGGKVIPATTIYYTRPYRPHRRMMNVGYVLFIAKKG